MAKTHGNLKVVIVLVAMLLMVFAPSFAKPSAFEGSYVYDASYKALIDYDGYYYSDIMKYSDLSTQDGVITTLFVIEKPNLMTTWTSNYTFLDAYGSNHTLIAGQGIDQTQETGLINATISYQYANGTSVMESHSMVYDYLFNPDPMYFYVQLGRGDTALVNVFKGVEATNITRLQIVKDTSNAVVTRVKLPSLQSMSENFGNIVQVEWQLISDLSVFVKIFLILGMIVVVPTLIVLTISWAIKKVRQQLKGDD